MIWYRKCIIWPKDFFDIVLEGEGIDRTSLAVCYRCADWPGPPA